MLRGSLFAIQESNTVKYWFYGLLISSVLEVIAPEAQACLRSRERKDFRTSQSTKIDSIFDSLLCPDRPAYITIPYYTSTASCSCTTPL
ncbi:MAG: hypothetical protein KZQ66_10705 [Candidatus Thiodiazotropha sp. (ex Lucinoma aequizonata)]|nr:hypothetical protein [Candidatus Thiodiazotropha sp. (ex Lucinoma aequizonata)]MCU7888025.1 hypothetical protein [Candidatus Thiodiazotropha sp. (ex Lucinoma aequizonata)]MCU7896917.1 hypothetical protein [Candidatus Thiodiazotropha sp. (ex Lucinoma aequizonata)]MCU7899697.1 hypothetical protein [Candidatus Thiodiazotropha sp. (ex Lucinoma aequizonata)]MCU7902401.1 hypothetical protein [Candidatus Thiodiazotropha sp. (ex Lucinoma aequizonata)]